MQKSQESKSTACPIIVGGCNHHLIPRRAVLFEQGGLELCDHLVAADAVLDWLPRRLPVKARDQDIVCVITHTITECVCVCVCLRGDGGGERILRRLASGGGGGGQRRPTGGLGSRAQSPLRC